MRIGRAYHWMQGHVWFGLLAYPIILFHSGFRFGGVFTEILMWTFTIVVISGIVGIVIQQYLPTKLLHDVKYETIYDQVDHVVEGLAEEAANLVKTATGLGGSEEFEVESMPAGGIPRRWPIRRCAAKTLNDFYVAHVKPYMAKTIPHQSKLSTEPKARVAFDQLRSSVPISMQEPLNDLALDRRGTPPLAVQKHMHHVLHGWLLVHVPLSYGLMLLAAWHAVYALRFVHPHW